MSRRKPSSKATKTQRLKTLKRRNAPRSAGYPSSSEPIRERDEARAQQVATAEILRVIRNSPTDVQPAFETMVRNAVSLCGSLFANVFRFDGELLHFVAAHNVGVNYVDLLHKKYPIRPDSSQISGRVLLTKSVVRLEDVLTDPEYDQQFPSAMGWRRMLGVPMLCEGDPLGVIVVGWAEAGPVPKAQEELLKTFADQAVIAIENVRLFESVEARTRELAKSLEDLRTTQDRLVQTEKLASLGQLTAGIAHEIKNPLNFVNNFSVVSAEMIGELQDTLSDVSLDEKKRNEITELMNTLRGNLDKVVQHGKRADAIVKNMLQHSREGSGEHRPVEINALVEESLNLAWHGARVENQSFEITLKQSFDLSAGEIDLFPQDITRALLNLISNGFYATTQRKAQTSDGQYVPTLAASTKSFGDRVEISIRDNGTGIPPEVKEKMFNPFFTTKPAGEGTGLGLSISHDIIVKQHGGSIEVETQPSEFTEIRVILPRVVALLPERS
jgi:two-component system, NtrC family, sensor kinase